jgi:hypothetical protein
MGAVGILEALQLRNYHNHKFSKSQGNSGGTIIFFENAGAPDAYWRLEKLRTPAAFRPQSWPSLLIYYNIVVVAIVAVR